MASQSKNKRPSRADRSCGAGRRRWAAAPPTSWERLRKAPERAGAGGPDRHQSGRHIPRTRAPFQHARCPGVRLLPIDPRQVVIRSRAVAPCYTIVRGALGTTPSAGGGPESLRVRGGGGGGRLVKRVQVGDNVVVAGTSQCGQCYQCLQGRPITVSSRFSRIHPASRRSRRSPRCRRNPRVRTSGIGGISEIMTAFEDLRAGLQRSPSRRVDAAGRSARLGFRGRPRRHALPACLRRGGVRRRTLGVGGSRRVGSPGQVR